MASKKTLLRISGGYGLSVVISGVVSILVIPAVIVLAGDVAWTTIAVSQAVAGFAFVLAVYGWGVIGPTSVAALPKAERGEFFFNSVLSRSYLSLVIVPCAIVVAIAVAGGDAWLAGLTCASGVLVALGAGWFYVGEGSPLRFLLFDTVPRVLGTMVGAGYLLASGNAVAFAAWQLGGVLVSAVGSSIDILRRYPVSSMTLSPSRALRNLRGQLAPVAMSATTSIYVNVPVLLVQFVVPGATAVYALAERIVRLSLYATRPVVQVAQSYVPRSDRVEQILRARRIVWVAVLLGLAGGLLYAVLGPWIGELLSGSTLAISPALSIAMGVNLAALLASQITSFACMTAFGLTKWLTVSTVIGAVVGTAAMFPLAISTGVVGLAWGLAAAEVSVLVVQLIILRRVLWTNDAVIQPTDPEAA